MDDKKAKMRPEHLKGKTAVMTAQRAGHTGSLTSCHLGLKIILSLLFGVFARRGDWGLFLEAMSGAPKTTLPFGDLLEGLNRIQCILATH